MKDRDRADKCKIQADSVAEGVAWVTAMRQASDPIRSAMEEKRRRERLGKGEK